MGTMQGKCQDAKAENAPRERYAAPRMSKVPIEIVKACSVGFSGQINRHQSNHASSSQQQLPPSAQCSGIHNYAQRSAHRWRPIADTRIARRLRRAAIRWSALLGGVSLRNVCGERLFQLCNLAGVLE